jgi:hypothetical protein
VSIGSGPSLSVGVPQLLFSAKVAPASGEEKPIEYSVSADGNEIYATRTVPAPEPDRRLAIVTNWLPGAGR